MIYKTSTSLGKCNDISNMGKSQLYIFYVAFLLISLKFGTSVGNVTMPVTEPPWKNITLKCSQLLPGQYWCVEPTIDSKTQQAVGCTEDKQFVSVDCYPVEGVKCDGRVHTGESKGFQRDVPCKWTNGRSFGVALLLSVFLGWLGIDRFYLGYYAIGVVKLGTLGFMFVWHLVDVLLIALQVVGPSDGSAYVVDYYGAKLMQIVADNNTQPLQPLYY